MQFKVIERVTEILHRHLPAAKKPMLKISEKEAVPRFNLLNKSCLNAVSNRVKIITKVGSWSIILVLRSKTSLGRGLE